MIRSSPSTRLFILVLPLCVTVKVCADDAGYSLLAEASSSVTAISAALASDSAGNHWSVGSFQGLLQFVGQPSLASPTNVNFFLAKLSASNPWTLIGGATAGAELKSVAIDSAGNVVVAGFFSTTLTIVGVNLVSAGANDILIAKFSSTGALLWAKTAGGSSSDYAFAVAVDSHDNILVAGYFNGAAAFGPLSLTSRGALDAFVAKYDSNGNPLWARSGGSSLLDYALAVAVDSHDNVYITGQYSSKATFDSLTSTSRGGLDAYLAKYSADGQIQWFKSMGGSSSDSGVDVVIDALDNPYVAGTFSGAAVFDTLTLTSVGGSDVFVAKYDTNGSPQWARSYGGADADGCRGLAIEPSGIIHIAVNLASAAHFDSIHVAPRGNQDAFILQVNSEGVLRGINQFGGDATDEITALCFANHELSFAGRTAGVAKLGSLSITNTTAYQLFAGLLAPPSANLNPPKLAIRMDTANPIVTWPNANLLYQLQSTSSLLAPPAWTPISDVITFSDDLLQFRALNPSFFRLARP